MAITAELKKLNETVTTQYAKQLYIAAGATDLAVEQLRTLPTQATKLQAKLTEIAGPEAVKELPVKAKELQDKAKAYAATINDRTSALLEDLTVRGEVLVKRIRRQESTVATEDAAKATTARAKATRTAAVKTAENAAQAVEDAAAKIG